MAEVNVLTGVYANPNTEGALVHFKERYDNFIGGEWVATSKW